MVLRVPIPMVEFIFMRENWNLFIPLRKKIWKLLRLFRRMILFGKRVNEIFKQKSLPKLERLFYYSLLIAHSS